MNIGRLRILITKERMQLLRDPFSIYIGIFLPILLLILIGYGMSMDVKDIKLAIVSPHTSGETREIISSFAASGYYHIQRVHSPKEADKLIRSREVDACLYLPEKNLKSSISKSTILIGVNAVNAIQARMIENYMKGTLSIALGKILAGSIPSGVSIESRMWYNEANDSRYYLVPGTIVIIMTIIGTLLTALVMAKEYEHGNLESIFVTPTRSSEILTAKAINNFILGLIGLSTALLAARYLFQVPIRGSIVILILVSSLYLVVALALGLLISSIAKNQFIASLLTLILTFMPAFMLSGFIYEIDNMPMLVQIITYLIPARYYIEFIQTIFGVGDVWPIILKDSFILFVFAVVFMFLAKIKNPKSLEG